MKDRQLDQADTGLHMVFEFINSLNPPSHEIENYFFNLKLYIAKARQELERMDKELARYDKLLADARAENAKLREGNYQKDLERELNNFKQRVIDCVQLIADGETEIYL